MSGAVSSAADSESATRAVFLPWSAPSKISPSDQATKRVMPPVLQCLHEQTIESNRPIAAASRSIGPEGGVPCERRVAPVALEALALGGSKPVRRRSMLSKSAKQWVSLSCSGGERSASR